MSARADSACEDDQPVRHVFAAAELDRMAERRDDTSWIEARRASASARFILTDSSGGILADAAGAAVRWLDADERADAQDGTFCSFLGQRDGVPYFLQPSRGAQLQPLAQSLDARWVGLRSAGACFGEFDAGMSAYATALSHWQARTRYCPSCGAPLMLVSAGHRGQCEACGHMEFPRTDAAIIVIVEHDGACLLGRQASWPAHRYSTLAGFVEPGETLEAAVAREVSEEAGVEVIAAHYHSSQPWPFPASLMLGFTATAAGRAIELRDGELQDARWFTPHALLEAVDDGSVILPTRVSVSWQLIAQWLRQRAGIELADVSARRDLG